MKKFIVFAILIVVVSSYKPKELTWVAIGDSITYLNDHADETGNRITKGYMTMLTTQLPNIHFTNQGHNGWTSGGIADAVDKLGITKADIYSVFLGTNDWWQGRPVGTLKDYENNTGNGTVYGSFRIIINKLKTLNDKAHIILITPLQRGDFVYINDAKNNAWGSYKDKNGQMLEQFALAVDSIAEKEHFDLVDLYHNSGITLDNMVKFKRLKDPQTGEYKKYSYPDYTTIPFSPGVDEYPYPSDAVDMTYDGLHPSDKGYEAITSMLAAIMKKY